jgi:hypothetical protein
MAKIATVLIMLIRGEGSMAYQAKCEKCRLRFVWVVNVYFPFHNPDVRCPGCGGELVATNYKCRYKISTQEAVVERLRVK